ncbi:MAG: MIP family channel protein [Flavobacteriales bacterium]|nr:MIP family channel protein [Flavobacteriales bacterium]
MRKYLIEFIGTFFLVFVGCGAMVINNRTGGDITHVGVAMSWGLIVMVLIYAIGDISGAHINPAVTIGFWIAKRFPFKEVLPYIVAQLAGAFVAIFSLKYLFPLDETLGASLPAGTWHQSFIFETILTFLLMFIILNVTTGAKEKGIMAGAAIGATVGMEAMFAGPICGASMNPARSIGPAIASGHIEHLWVYIVSTILGAILAVAAFKLTREKEHIAEN